jgi:hypothetical protein
MKPLQQDDIKDWLNEPKRKFRFIHLPTGKIVKAETKSIANIKFREIYNLKTERKDVRQTRGLE